MTGAGNPTRGAVPPGEPRWFAVNTQPQREELAALHLLDQGHQVFLPRHARLVRHARKLEQRVTALFPGYLFVRLDPERARWRAVNGTRGVRAILSDGDRPLPVRRGVVEAIMAETGPGGVLAMPDELHTGDRVRVFDGPFADLSGTVQGLSGAERVRVLLDLMELAVPVSLPRQNLIRAA